MFCVTSRHTKQKLDNKLISSVTALSIEEIAKLKSRI
ncbi:hypothetical protein Megpolyxen_01518 (plasmid) [Candidatus Megaera polyxenophila]|nr:hypothetical protein Megpolyxen_01518 [Candidatus Megaera polyxenophila]